MGGRISSAALLARPGISVTGARHDSLGLGTSGCGSVWLVVFHVGLKHGLIGQF